MKQPDETVIVNEMTIKKRSGPRHYVVTNIQAPEIWMVDGVPTTVEPGAIVGFPTTDDALHFLSQARALDVGGFRYASRPDGGHRRIPSQCGY
jgi:hypothetical protein